MAAKLHLGENEAIVKAEMNSRPCPKDGYHVLPFSLVRSRRTVRGQLKRLEEKGVPLALIDCDQIIQEGAEVVIKFDLGSYNECEVFRSMRKGQHNGYGAKVNGI
jgi:hypothetical protein